MKTHDDTADIESLIVMLKSNAEMQTQAVAALKTLLRQLKLQPMEIVDIQRISQAHYNENLSLRQQLTEELAINERLRQALKKCSSLDARSFGYDYVDIQLEIDRIVKSALFTPSDTIDQQ